MSLVSIVLGRRGKSGFGFASTAEEVTRDVDLGGKTILVTGVASGLGLESARVLSNRGARIIGAARSREKAESAMRGFRGETVAVACDLEEPASVRAAAASIEGKVDVILCNAGIMALPVRTLKHGLELQFLTNHVGHFLLVTGLLDRLADDGRVVVLSSAAHKMAPSVGIQFDDLTLEKNYTPWRSYGQSKLANLLFARALAKRFAGTKKTANAVHPGVIATNLGRHMNVVAQALYPVASAIAMKNVHEGAATQCYCAVHPSLANVSGEYFADCNVAPSSRQSRDPAMAERLWEITSDLVQKL